MTIFADRKAGTGIRSGLWTYSRTNTYLYQYDMLKNLVIVESPAKAKTIEKFLGNDYKVMSSYGHIRDLKKHSFSIDVDNSFEPIYEIPDDKKNLVSELRRAAKEAQTVWLASDEDREGEAIAWHLSEVLGLDPKTTRRIVFHEITKGAILDAIKQPRTIDTNLVDAQQARRVLDRIIGFELSPVLWRKIKPGLSAGRVQSVAVRLIVEREQEIKAFKPDRYFRLTGIFATGDGASFRAELARRLSDEAEARDLLQGCAHTTYSITGVNVHPLKKSPAAPFTTSTLQQEASRKLGMTVAQTMMVAQKLYENGLITYMRTDSLNLSQVALAAIAQEITTSHGKEYLKQRHYHTSSKGAQEAHEAIRPTYIDRHTIEGTAQERRLYDLIWKRTVASQMADAQIEKTVVDITPAGSAERFTASGEVVKFDGFLRVYIESHDDIADNTEDTDILPAMAAGDYVTNESLTATERYTQQPPRYTEASLVKKMEELGIGRPSTYAPTISTIQARDYVTKGESAGAQRDIKTLTMDANGNITEATHTETYGADKGKLMPTDIGVVVNSFLTMYFPNILDYNFTAGIEQKFDAIADGKMQWNSQMETFYNKFHPKVEEVMDMRLEHKVGERLLGTDPASGEPVSVKIGRFGPLVQIGSNDSDNKPRFASLLKGQSLETITLDEALHLFDFPRTLGTFEDKDVSVGIGRFGPYVRHDNKYVSIPKDEAPAAVTLSRAIELIEAKRTEDANRVLRTFDQEPEMQILRGRFGPYIAYKGSNYKLPRGTTPETAAEMTLEQALEVVNTPAAEPKRTTRRATTRKKTTK